MFNLFKYDQKWDGFEMTNVTLKLNEAEIHRRKGKSKNKNNNQKDEKIFVEFEVDSIPERRLFLLSRDFASVRPTGTKVDPFQVSIIYHYTFVYPSVTVHKLRFKLFHSSHSN